MFYLFSKVNNRFTYFSFQFIDLTETSPYNKRKIPKNYTLLQGVIFIATIKEIAKACNVSISTVSNILNGKNKASDEVKKLVLETAKEMNYVPNYMAKNLKQNYRRHQ